MICTSATLKLGGDFTALAISIGLRPDERVADDAPPDLRAARGAGHRCRWRRRRIRGADRPTDPAVLPWRAIDVGSPFDYPRPGDSLHRALTCRRPDATASGRRRSPRSAGWSRRPAVGRSGLFSSRRAAEAAAEALREMAPHLPILCQGDGQLLPPAGGVRGQPGGEPVRHAVAVAGPRRPGETCQLVIIDRIPFPRPDDPLMSARAAAADRAGGNGFMAVSATHAALLLAQGAGG